MFFRCALVSLLTGAVLLGRPSAGHADLISIQFSLNSLPVTSGTVTPLTLTGGDLGLRSFGIGSGAGAANVSITTAANQGVVQGNSAGQYAEPATGPSSFFTGPYFSTGKGGSIDIDFLNPQKFLGLIWGSVDAAPDGGNLITFRRRGAIVGQVSGATLDAATGRDPAGAQGYGGSYYTLLNDAAGSFDEVDLSSSVVSFESAAYESSTGTVAVPEPASAALLGLGLLALYGAVRRRGLCRLD